MGPVSAFCILSKRLILGQDRKRTSTSEESVILELYEETDNASTGDKSQEKVVYNSIQNLSLLPSCIGNLIIIKSVIYFANLFPTNSVLFG